MAAYPVTVRQFQAFIDGGRLHRTLRRLLVVHWLELEAALQRRRRTRPRRWAGIRRFVTEHLSNHPAEVDWYEAAAFAGWLERLRRDGVQPARRMSPTSTSSGCPTKPNANGRRAIRTVALFPWGDHYLEGAANIDETAYRERVGRSISRVLPPWASIPSAASRRSMCTTWVGMFSEWCQTVWREDRYTADNDAESVFHRVVRGGHYHNGLQFARAASRTGAILILTTSTIQPRLPPRHRPAI